MKEQLIFVGHLILSDSFSARSIGRGGSATTRLKRYEIGRIYHKAIAGGHPRESLEASFDVIFDDSSLTEFIEAETIMVALQVIKILPARSIMLFERLAIDTPLWYLRLNHTRLGDAILDLCNIPQRDFVRRGCLRLLSHFLSAQPASLSTYMKRKSTSADMTTENAQMDNLVRAIDEAVKEHGLPEPGAGCSSTSSFHYEMSTGAIRHQLMP